MNGEAAEQRVVVGRIVGVHGVQGWVKVYSWTRPPENIFGYARWLLRREPGWQPATLAAGRSQGKGLVARLEGVGDREAARAYVGCDVAVARSELPALEPDEYYWSDLEGLRVETIAGDHLGMVDHLIDTGANDVLVVRGERERLVPFTPGEHVVEVDLARALIRVDWDPDF